MNYFGSHRNIKTITDQEAQEFTNQIELVKTDKSPTEKTPADSTRVKHLKNSKVLFNQAQNWNYIRNNPFKNITITNISKEDWHFLNFNEFNALLKALNKLSIRENKKQLDQERILRLRAFYGVMYGCGLRFGEAIHLWWDKNIDFINSQIHIKNRKSKNGYPGFNLKNHQDRTLPCPRWVMGLLEELKKVSHKNNPYVLLSEERLGIIKDKFKEWSSEDKLDKWANDVMVNNTNRDFVVNCRRAGIVSSDRLSVHCLRKSYGTLLADMNTPVHTLKQLMGHSSIETTLKFYIKNSDENSWKAVRGWRG